MAEAYDPTPDEEAPEEPAELQEQAVDEPQYVIDPENDAWLWSIPVAALLSFVVVFAIRLGYIPSPFDDFQWVVAVEGFVLLVLLVLGVLTFVER